MRNRAWILIALVLCFGLPGIGSARAAGCSWTRLPNAPHSGQGGDIAAAGNQAWVVLPYASPPQVAHWDGVAWESTTLQAPGLVAGDLRGVAAANTHDVWAVGHQIPLSGNDSPIAAHWDGDAWTIEALPHDASANGFFQAASASGPSDVWAVGYDSGDVNQAIADHWNGSGWSAESAGLAPAASLTSVAAISPTDAWAIGNGPLGDTIYRWNGARWHDVPYPNSTYPLLRDISASSPTDAWVVGALGVGGGVGGGTFTIHWDGMSWTQVPAPKLGARANGLAAVADSSPRRAWAVGRWGYAAGFPLLLRWNGAAWKVVRAASPREKYQLLVAASVAPGTNTVWVLGNQGLVERSC
jgi:hypothetical protein